MCCCRQAPGGFSGTRARLRWRQMPKTEQFPMNPLVRLNVERSLRFMAEGEFRIPEGLVEHVTEDDAEAGPQPWALDRSPFVTGALEPWFHRSSSGELASPQEPLFGFYLVRNVLRGILASVRFVQAGDLLHGSEFLAMSVFSHYTASFHLLHSFLALSGRVVIDEPCGPPTIRRTPHGESLSFRSLRPSPEVVMGLLTKRNAWKFEPRSRSHAKRWRELESVLRQTGDEVPDFFTRFFRYLLSYGPHCHTEDADLVAEGLRRLAELRHDAVYQGFGDDRFVYDALANRDTMCITGIEARSGAYRDFATSLLWFCVTEFFALKDSIQADLWARNRLALVVSAFAWRPFEYRGHHIASDRELSSVLARLEEWLLPSGQMSGW